jgi:hypothetical protein
MSKSGFLVVVGSSLAALCIATAAAGMGSVTLSEDGGTTPAPTTTTPPPDGDNPWHG